MLNAIVKELRLRRHELTDGAIETIYFGGGSPSIWPVTFIRQILDTIYDIAPTTKAKEITLEANPDDLELSYCKALTAIGVNRLSIGIQSFNEEELEWMNRAHNSQQAHNCIENVKKAGIKNLSIDLIYGSPLSNLKSWQKNLTLFKKYNIDHLSAYMLTVEPKTTLAHDVEKGTIKVLDQSAIEQFTFLKKWAREQNLEHYEISNFCFNGKRALHNSNYWNSTAYIGVGPGAHSFDGNNRRSWNIANNSNYIASIAKNHLPSTTEVLSPIDKFNEAIMIGLRRIEGIPFFSLEQFFRAELMSKFKGNLATISGSLLRKNEHKIQLTDEGILHADAIISDLMLTD